MRVHCTSSWEKEKTRERERGREGERGLTHNAICLISFRRKFFGAAPIPSIRTNYVCLWDCLSLLCALYYAFPVWKYFRYAFVRETKDWNGVRGDRGDSQSCLPPQIVHKLSENEGKFHEIGNAGHIIHSTSGGNNNNILTYMNWSLCKIMICGVQITNLLHILA